MYLILDLLAEGLSYRQALGIQADWYEDHGKPAAADILRCAALRPGCLAGGGHHSLYADPEGTVWSWGHGSGRPPIGTEGVAVSAADGQSLILQRSGRVVALERGNYYNVNPALAIHDAQAIAMADSYFLALRHDGTVAVRGEWSQRRQPPANLRAVAIAAGNGHAVALQRDGSVVTWNTYPLDDDFGFHTPPSGLRAVAIACTGYHTLALTPDGEVVAWGSTIRAWECSVPLGLRAVAIAAGQRHSLALTPEGEVVVWGPNYQGQSNVPKGLRAVAIAAGAWHSLALTPEGKVVAWGYDDYRQCQVPDHLRA